MEDVIKYNIKKVNNKTLLTQKQEIRQVTYMHTYTICKTFNFGKQYQLKKQKLHKFNYNILKSLC